MADSDTHAGRNDNGTFATRINGNLTALRCLINAITIIRETNDLVVLRLPAPATITAHGNDYFCDCAVIVAVILSVVCL